MPRRLIVNGDDFGKAKGTVPAIIALYKAGVVTSTTAMVNQPHWGEAAAYLRGHPGLGQSKLLAASKENLAEGEISHLDFPVIPVQNLAYLA